MPWTSAQSEIIELAKKALLDELVDSGRLNADTTELPEFQMVAMQAEGGTTEYWFIQCRVLLKGLSRLFQVALLDNGEIWTDNDRKER